MYVSCLNNILFDSGFVGNSILIHEWKINQLLASYILFKKTQSKALLKVLSETDN